MRTYPIRDAAGVMFAFEVENVYVTARALAAILSAIDGVSNVRRRQPLAGCPDVHIRFVHRGRECVVWEFYGDSSRWWIGPDGSEDVHESIADVERACANHLPGLVTRVVGDLASLRMPSLRPRE